MASPFPEKTDPQATVAETAEGIRRLPSRPNSFSPSYRLPPEVLVRIFIDLGPCPLATSTHVCKYWREVSLEFPCLWSIITIESHERSTGRLRLFLQRSKGTPLTITIHGIQDRKLYRELIKELSSHRCRMQKLLLSFNSNELQTTINFFASDFPVLSEVSLEPSQTSNPGARFALPKDLMGNAPELYSLRLCACVIPWHSSTFKGLTRLQLEAMWPLEPSPEELWLVLKSATALEDVRLQDVLSRLEPAPTSWPLDADVDLPHIHHIDLTETRFMEYAHFFSRVRIPANAHVTLDVITTYRGQGSIAERLTWLPPSLFSAVRSESTPSLALDMTLGPLFSFIITQTSTQHPSRGCERTSDLDCGGRINATFHHHFKYACDAVRATFNSLWFDAPLVSIRDLRITTYRDRGEWYLEGIPWSDILSALPNLRLLHAQIGPLSTAQLIDALEPQYHGVPVAELRELRFPPLAVWSKRPKLEGVAHVFEERARAGSCLDKLAVSKRLLTESECARLRRIFGSIELTY
ncbi:hypothetical protein CONPUDRAFT_162022 [Coniophora puteana RWD-64-598 SS2]|uniref:F-box domain-containing protein n=1 Tax=Coniophora puteana (strain RWD-64-598) TaxID=741705 RepID=A0A5M3N168_CONPW|nr:uncharacterized protein CONPUDRAFT_162022 [Coniophora puteana RWD-64-598 SS2]EIW84645.1 hypothetical protein CONPUDRAFT_162022 [Coniophora puteana RWD-64-598 SS2]